MDDEKRVLLMSKLNQIHFTGDIIGVNRLRNRYVLPRDSHDGFIDVRTAVMSGKMQSGSLGLLVIFLGVGITLAVVKKSGIMSEKKGERIQLEIGDKKVVCENLSFPKIQQISELIKDAGHGDPALNKESHERARFFESETKKQGNVKDDNERCQV